MTSSFVLCLVLPLVLQEVPAPPDPAVEGAPTPAVEAAPGDVTTPPSLPMDRLLPSQLMLHFEVAGLAELRAVAEQSALWKLLAEPEVQTFMAPLFEHVDADLRFLLFDSPDAPDFDDPKQIEALLENPSFGRISFSLLNIQGEMPHFVMSLESPEHAPSLFEMLRESLRDDEDGQPTEELEIEGRSVLRNPSPEDEKDPTHADFILDGHRIIVTVGDFDAGRLLAAGGERLADAEWYQQARQNLGLQDPAAFAVLDFPFTLKTGMAAANASAEDDSGEPSPETLKQQKYLARSIEESPAIQAMKSMSVGWEVQGQDIVERWSIQAPGDRSEWWAYRSFSGIAEEHAALCDRKADIFLTYAFDLENGLRIAEKEQSRIAKLVAEAGGEVSALESMNLTTFSDEVKNETGIDLAGALLPALGDRVSFAVDMPSGLNAIPGISMVFDVKDGAAFDTFLDQVLAKDDEVEEVEFTVTDYKGVRVVSANLLNAGIPAIPTIGRIENQVLITLSPQALKSAILNRGRDKHLGSSERFAALREYAGEGEHSMLGWVDMPSVVGYTYTAVSGLLAAMGQELDGVGDLDFALLPAAETVVQHFGPALFSASETELGFVIDGRSTVGNPITGTLFSAVAIGGTAGAAVALHKKVLDTQQETAEAQLRELALAMQAYKDSVGGGQYPESPVLLVDRGILLEADKLVDTADPKPKKVRSSTGDRIAVSYQIGSIDFLPSYTHAQLGDGVTQILYTRGPWYDAHGDDAYLIVGLGHPEPVVIAVSENQFKK